MLDDFWKGLGEELGKTWAARVLSPAFAFWTGGVAALWWHAHHDDVRQNGWRAELEASTAWLGDLPVVAQVGLVVGALVLVAVSGLVAEVLTRPLLRGLEGYWRRPRLLRAALIDHRSRRRRRVDDRLQQLMQKPRGTLTPGEYVELRSLRTNGADPARLAVLQAQAGPELTADERLRLTRDRRALHATPDDDHDRMPTRLGDTLRTAELRAGHAYGLDGVVCWPALWLLLPEGTRTPLTAARARLDAAVRACLWGGLFVVWTPWAWAAAPGGLLVAVLSYRHGALPAAASFGTLVATAYDVHRMLLYDALHVPRPAGPEEERTTDGRRVTALLWDRWNETGATYRFEPLPDS